jgi:hypothetical protein
MLCESIIDKRRWEEHKVCELHLSKVSLLAWTA